MHFRLETALLCRYGRGWIVAPLDLEEIGQLFTYREVLETAAVRLVATREDKAPLDAFEAAVGAHGHGMPTGDAHRLGTDFHVQLVALAGNDFITRGVVDALTRLSRARWLDTADNAEGWDEHRALLAALRAGDGEKAAALVTAHVRGSRDRLLKILREGRRGLRLHGIRLA